MHPNSVSTGSLKSYISVLNIVIFWKKCIWGLTGHTDCSRWIVKFAKPQSVQLCECQRILLYPPALPITPQPLDSSPFDSEAQTIPWSVTGHCSHAILSAGRSAPWTAPKPNMVIASALTQTVLWLIKSM